MSQNLLQLFLQEAETHSEALANGLLEWEANTDDLSKVEPLMRAAHSLKGASRIVGLDKFGELAHILEDCFVAAQEGKITLDPSHYDSLLAAVDFLAEITHTPESELKAWPGDRTPELENIKTSISNILSGTPSPTPQPSTATPPETTPKDPPSQPEALTSTSLHEVFKNQTLAQLKPIQEALQALQKDIKSFKDYPSLLTATEAIYGTATVAGQDEATKIATSLQEIFSSAQENKIISPENLESATSLTQNLLTLTEENNQPAQTSLETPDDGLLTIFNTQTQTHLPTLTSTLKQCLDNPTHKEPTTPLIDALGSIHGAATVAGQDAIASLSQELLDTLSPLKDKNLPSDPKTLQSLSDSISKLETLCKNLKTTPTAPQTIPPLEKQAEAPQPKPTENKKETTTPPPTTTQPQATTEKPTDTSDTKDSIVKVSAANLNRLMGLAAESLIETRRLQPMRQGFLHLKALHTQLKRHYDTLNYEFALENDDAQNAERLKDVTQNANTYRNVMQEQLQLYDDFSRNNSLLSSRLYGEVLASRMRPFAECTQGFPRLVRNLSRSLNKKISLEITGQDTPVDRDILEKLEAPLNHIVRNACDHAIEDPETREQAGKDPQGSIKIHAHHSGGMLLLTITDDGKGIDKDDLKQKILQKELLTPEMAATLSDEEILSFLFLPGFSTAQEVTDISGRGVGLDVVQTLIQEVSGNIRVETELGQGTTFHLKLPITRSVIRTLLVQIEDQPYAFPLSRINRTLRVYPQDVQHLEAQKYFHVGKENIAMLSAHQTLGYAEPDLPDQEEIPVVVLGENGDLYSLIVDSILGETELVARPLDPRLGKIPCISAASITDDGTPILILDVDDILSTVERILSGGSASDAFKKDSSVEIKTKSILVVDDSATVRETQRHLLEQAGYNVQVAIDGADGWNTLRADHFDLVVSDVDMPRMNGFEFVALVREDPQFANLPIIIVSYKDKDEHREQGLQAGATEYLTKSAFRDDTFLNTIKKLIGNPRST